MKRFVLCALAAAICALFAFTAAGDETGTVTIREWMDSKGETTGLMVVCVKEIINPVLAAAEDETAAVNLFGVIVNGEFADFYTADICSGDVLVLLNPRFNVFEDSVEMADAVLLRKLPCFRENGSDRIEAAEYDFTASPENELEIRDTVFYGDVTVNGEGENVRFSNCEFHGNVINAAAAKTVVWITDDCEFIDGAHCVLASGVREADMDYSIPKFGICLPVQVDCEDLGGIIALGDFDIYMNDRVFAMGDAEYMMDEEGNVVPFEEDNEFYAHVVTRWWENGEEVLFTMAVK